MRPWIWSSSKWPLIYATRPFHDGYRDGFAQGQTFGHAEGRQLGREKGFDVWVELGYYEGTVAIFQRKFQDEQTAGQSLCVCPTNSSTRKAQKQAQQLDSLAALLQDMPRKNESARLAEDAQDGDSDKPDLAQLMERIRARFRLVCKSLQFDALVPSFTAGGSAAAASSGADDDASTSAKLTKVAGRMIDVQQLTY